MSFDGFYEHLRRTSYISLGQNEVWRKAILSDLNLLSEYFQCNANGIEDAVHWHLAQSKALIFWLDPIREQASSTKERLQNIRHSLNIPDNVNPMEWLNGATKTA